MVGLPLGEVRAMGLAGQPTVVVRLLLALPVRNGHAELRLGLWHHWSAFARVSGLCASRLDAACLVPARGGERVEARHERTTIDFASYAPRRLAGANLD